MLEMSTSNIPIESVVSETTEKVVVDVQEAVQGATQNTVTEDLSGALMHLVTQMADEIKEIPDVAAILRQVPKCVSVVHTLPVPGSEKKDMVLRALRSLAGILADKKVITDVQHGEMLTFIDIVVPVSIDTTLDVVKGRVSFSTLKQAVVSNPQAVASVVETSIKCCIGFIRKNANTHTALPVAESATESSKTEAV